MFGPERVFPTLPIEEDLMRDGWMRFAAIGALAWLVPNASAAAAPQDESKELVEVAGTVVVDDGKGGEVTDESGSIVLGVHSGRSWRPQKAFLIEGEWKTKVPVGTQLSFDVFELEGGTACWLLDGEKELPRTERSFESAGPRELGLRIPKERRMAVRARYVPPCRVHVVDAATGAELAHVVAVLDVYHDADRSTMGNAHWLGPQQIHPTPWWDSDLRAKDAASPLALTVDLEQTFSQWKENLWVHAPGYCWAPVEVDFRVGGEPIVKLVRGGMLDVVVAGESLPESTKIVVRKGRGSATAAAPTQGAAESSGGEDDDESADDGDGDEGDDEGTPRFTVSTNGSFSSMGFGGGREAVCAEWWFAPRKRVTFDALPAGDYRVSLEIGERFGKRQEFATTNVTVKADATATATLKVDHAPEIPQPMALRGTVRIDPAWGDVDFEVFLRPTGTSPLLPQKPLRIDRRELVRDPADAGLLKLPERNVAPGTYDLSIEAFGIERSVAVLRAAKPIAIEVGPPVDATFRFVDAKTKAPLQVQEPSWSAVDPANAIGESMGFRGMHFFSRDGETKTSDHFTFRVPTGRISVSASREDYDSFAATLLDVTADEKEFTIPLRHLTGVRVRLQIDGRPADWMEAMRGGQKPGSSLRFSDFEPHVRARAAGGAGEEAMAGMGPSQGGRYVAVEHAGDYTVSLPPLECFEPVAPRDVTIVDQQFTDVVFDLVRKKK